MSDPIPAAAYVRYSSELQDELSIQGQLDEIRVFAERSGYEVVSVYADRAERGSSDTRPQFVALQDAAKSPTCPFKAVICWKSDRIARRYELAAGFRGFLRRRGIALLFVAEPNIDGPVGSLLSAVMDGMNEFYSANLGENVRRGMKASVARGYASGGTAPFGYRKIQVPADNGKMKWKWEPDPETAPIVRQIYEMYAQGGVGLQSICTWLNGQDIKTARGGIWHPGQVWALLFMQRDAYLGRLTYNKFSRKEPEPGNGIRKGNTAKTRRSIAEWTITEDAHPAIISPELAARVDMARSGREPLSETISRKKEIRLLTGLMRCGICGKKFVKSAGRNGRKYYCCSSSKWDASCGNRYFRCEETEERVVSAIRKRVDTLEAEIVEAIRQGENEEPHIPAALFDLEREREELKRKQSNLVDAISDGIIPKDLAAEKMKALQNALERITFEAEVQRHQSEKKSLSMSILDDLAGLPEGWFNDESILRSCVVACFARL